MSVITNPFIGKEEGFGEQYKIIIFYMIYAELNHLKFLYSPFKEVAHNYDNDTDFLNKLENVVNIKNNILNYNHKEHENEEEYFVSNILYFIHKNISLFEQTKSLKFIKHMFYKNKTNPYTHNDSVQHIAIHIRRHNQNDGMGHRGLYIKDDVYKEIIKTIQGFSDTRTKIFHIFSQGDLHP